MVVWILLEGSKVHQSMLFIILEVIINVWILTDFILKLYLKGYKKFFNSWTNIFDTIVVMSCFITFLIMFFTSSVSLIVLEEIIEEMFFVLWWSLQYLRIFLFLKHQKEAKSRSKAIDIKDFHSDSFQNGDDIMYTDDIEFNSRNKQSNNFAKKNASKKNYKANNKKGSNDIEISYDLDIELEDLSSRNRESKRVGMSFNDDNIKYSD